MKFAESARATCRDFERGAWQGAVKLYENSFGAQTSQFVTPLLAAVGARPGDARLDIATGPGQVAVAAPRRGSTGSGLDFSSAMTAKARRFTPASLSAAAMP
jgi:trans-aconitate methyltransferase